MVFSDYPGAAQVVSQLPLLHSYLTLLTNVYRADQPEGRTPKRSPVLVGLLAK